MRKRPRPLNDYLQTDRAFLALLARAQRQSVLLQQIRDLLPPPLDRHCLAAVQDNHRLVLYVDSSAWASRLRFFSRDLAVNLKQRKVTAQEIVVRVLIESRRQPAEQPPAPQLSHHNALLLQQVADTISDPELQAALIKLSGHGA